MTLPTPNPAGEVHRIDRKCGQRDPTQGVEALLANYRQACAATR